MEARFGSQVVAILTYDPIPPHPALLMGTFSDQTDGSVVQPGSLKPYSSKVLAPRKSTLTVTLVVMSKLKTICYAHDNQPPIGLNTACEFQSCRPRKLEGRIWKPCGTRTHANCTSSFVITLISTASLAGQLQEVVRPLMCMLGRYRRQQPCRKLLAETTGSPRKATTISAPEQ